MKCGFPDKYRSKMNIKYPPNATELIEEYFYRTYDESKIKPGCMYIDIFWTNIYVNYDYNHDELQKELDKLDKTKQYFTIVQHDDCIRHKLPENTIVFSSGGKNGIAIPLNYRDDNKVYDKYKSREENREFLCSFVGTNTHWCRTMIVNFLGNYPDTAIWMKNNWTPNYSDREIDNFLDVTRRSVFCLAPRGYGITSFRFVEALELGTIPVYIWEGTLWLPYSKGSANGITTKQKEKIKDMIDYNRLCVVVHTDELNSLHDRLKSYTPAQIQNMKDYYQEVKHLFTVEGTVEMIYATLTDLL